eukprot:234530_1
MATKQNTNPQSESPDGHWIHAQEVESGRYFWVHSKTHDLRYTMPQGFDRKASISRRRGNSHSTHNHTHSNSLTSPNHLSKQKSRTPPPPSTHSKPTSPISPKPPDVSKFRRSKPSPPKQRRKKQWFRNKNSRSNTVGDMDYELSKQTNASQTLPNYVVLADPNESNTQSHPRARVPRKLRAQSTIRPRYRGALASISTIPKSLDIKKDKSKYDMDPNATLDKMHHELIGYDALDMNESIAKNEYIKSNILQFLAYRYQSLSSTHDKQFKPPLNDPNAQMKYFRNIAYPQYRLDTNLKIQQIINQNIYDNQTPYLRIRIPFNISLNVFGITGLNKQRSSQKLSKMFGTNDMSDEKGKKMNEIFNIELARENILDTTVRQFFHTVCKQVSGLKSDERLEELFLGHPNTPNALSIDEEDEEEEYHHNNRNRMSDWSLLAIKANGLEEYIFYSVDDTDKICNYECVRYALSHQLDANDNKCFLTLVYLSNTQETIERLQQEYIDYGKYLDMWRTNIKQICFKQQFSTRYLWLDVINQQFNVKKHHKDYMSMNDGVYQWKKQYDVRCPDNNTVLLEQYKCLFEYTIHSLINADKLPRFNRKKHSAIILTFELQIGSISYAQDIWLTAPKLPQKHKIIYKQAIYKSKNLRIHVLPREVIFSVIVFGIPHSMDQTEPHSVIYSARGHDPVVSWFGSDNEEDEGDKDIHVDGTTRSRSRSSRYATETDLIVKEEPIDIDQLKFNRSLTFNPDDEFKTTMMCSPSSTRHRQYSYGKAAAEVDTNGSTMQEDSKKERQDDACGVFESAFSGCDPLAFLRIPLVDDFHCYRQGTFSFHLWDIPIWKESKHEPRDPFGRDLFWRFLKPSSFPPNTRTAQNTCEITITIGPNPSNNPDYEPPKCIAPLFNCVFDTASDVCDMAPPKSDFCARDFKRMDFIVRRDPLTRLNRSERLYIWRCRDKLSRTKPRALAVFLRCVDWRNPYFRSEAYHYLYKWKLPNLLSDMVELLAHWNFPDNRIKHFVIERSFSKLSDIEIKHILLQLVQIIKIEPHHTSFTSNFLIERGLRSVTRIGHFMYWLLKSEIDASFACYTRFSLILEDFLCHCFSYPSKLYVQQRLVDGLNAVSAIVSCGKKKKQPSAELKVRMQHILRRMNKSMMAMKDGISLALNPKYKLRSFAVDRCRFMGSAQAPLWLVFSQFDVYADPQEVSVLFKSGDDLRQDLLTLQIMDSMNQLWLTSGYCMRLRIYGVITTGKQSGFIEIVSGARTLDDLSVNLGGGVVRGPKDETVHVKYLKNCSNNSQLMAQAHQDRYLRSCAGYCIASWIIGIGDRHSDNMMVHECGDLFHIDFGHFLGHFKVKKFSIRVMPGIKMKTEWNRERSPFVFLPAMKYCIKYDFSKDCPGDSNSNNYDRFVDLCTTAMDAIRRRHRLILNLFALMLPSQMPELLNVKDIVYCRQQMQLNLTKNNNYDRIRQYVKKELNDSVNDGTRIFDHIVHAYVHSK